MINYKQSLMLMFCVASMNSMNAMEKKKGEAKEVVNKDIAVTERLNELLNVETDSIVIQRGRTILSNDDYNDNPALLAAYGNFFAEFHMYKVGEERYYNMLIERGAVEAGEDADYIREYLYANLDDAWKKEKKEILKNYDVTQAKKRIYSDFGPNQEVFFKDTKMQMSAYKEWMRTRDFASTKFLVETICKLMGERKLIDQETTKVLELLKQYDNK